MNDVYKTLFDTKPKNNTFFFLCEFFGDPFYPSCVNKLFVIQYSTTIRNAYARRMRQSR